MLFRDLLSCCLTGFVRLIDYLCGLVKVNRLAASTVWWRTRGEELSILCGLQLLQGGGRSKFFLGCEEDGCDLVTDRFGHRWATPGFTPTFVTKYAGRLMWLGMCVWHCT